MSPRDKKQPQQYDKVPRKLRKQLVKQHGMLVGGRIRRKRPKSKPERNQGSWYIIW